MNNQATEKQSTDKSFRCMKNEEIMESKRPFRNVGRIMGNGACIGIKMLLLLVGHILQMIISAY